MRTIIPNSKQYYTKKIEELLKTTGHRNPRTRHYDLTESTDDPGNTELAMLYTDILTEKQQDALRQEFDKDSSLGDYYEELFFMDQNNETIIFINANK